MNIGALVPTRSRLQNFRGLRGLGQTTDCSGVFTAGFTGGLSSWSDWISGAGSNPLTQLSTTTLSCDPMFALGVAAPPLAIIGVAFMFLGGKGRRR